MNAGAGGIRVFGFLSHATATYNFQVPLSACLSGLMVVPLLYSHRHPVTSSPRGDDLLHSRIHGLDGRIYSLTKSKGKSTSKENTGECELGINSEKEHQAYRSIPSRTPCSKTSQYIATISPQYLTPSHHASHPQSQSPLYMLKSLLSWSIFGWRFGYARRGTTWIRGRLKSLPLTDIQRQI